MKTTFLVLGRRFDDRMEAVTFAQAEAERLDKSVDIKAEVEHSVTKVERSWIARMHPPGFTRTVPVEKTA